MYRFLFTVKFNKAIDLFYEYVISRCRRYFDVPNKDIVFRINYNKREESLLIVVFSDGAKDFLDNLSDEEFSFTPDEEGWYYMLIPADGKGWASVLKYSP